MLYLKIIITSIDSFTFSNFVVIFFILHLVDVNNNDILRIFSRQLTKQKRLEQIFK